MPLTLVTRTHGRSTTEQLSTIPVPAASRSWLTRLLAGEVDLPPLVPGAPPSVPHSPVEATAIARALSTPDLFLVDAADRTSRERILAGLAKAAAERGERVLVLSPDPAAADRLVETLAGDRGTRTVRALADDENPHRPAPTVTRQTTAHAGTGRADQLKREAALTVTSLEAKLSRLERASGFRLRLDEIERERATIAERSTALEAEVRAESEANRAAALAPLHSEHATLRAAHSEKQIALESVRASLAQALKKPGFFARLFGAARPADDPAALEQAIRDHERVLADLTDRESKVRAESDAIARQFDEAIAKTGPDELAARRVGFDPRLIELDAEAARLDLMVREFLPRRATPDDTVENGAPARSTRTDAERELAIARTRLQELTAAGPDLGRRLLSETQIVVGTPGSLDADPIFKVFESASSPFGLLVLDHAEELTEPAFERLAPLAARWVLAGAAAHSPQPRLHLNGNGHNVRHRSTEPLLFTHLARLLDREPWLIEGDRLVFRLVHLSAEKRKTLPREPVLDHPNVELGVTSAGDGEPVLAEIAFPASTSIVQAKSFLFSQLGEVLLRPCGDWLWHRTEEALTACWPLADTVSGDWVDLEPGVREKVTGLGAAAFTAAIAFDLTAGWDQARAEEWLAARIPTPSPSRLAVIPREAGFSSP